MKKLATLIIFTIAVVTAGCATQQLKLSEALQNDLDAPLICTNADECKLMWERATFFVSENAGFKIQIHNNTLIQTFNPTNSSVKLAFNITREPLGDGKYKIWTKAWCANMFGCNPHPLEAIAKGKRYMRTGQK